MMRRGGLEAKMGKKWGIWFFYLRLIVIEGKHRRFKFQMQQS